MTAREISTPTTRNRLGDDGIVRSIALPGTEQTLADATENLRAIRSLLPGGRLAPLLVDARQARPMTREARAFYADPGPARVAAAVAVLVGSPATRIAGNFYLRLNQPRTPTRLFTSETDALAWLRGFVPR